MMANRFKAMIVLLLAAAALVCAHVWRPTKYLADTRPKLSLEQIFPRAFGDWRIDTRMPVQLVSPDQAAMLNKIYNDTLNRVYVNGDGDRIMLSVAYGGDQSDGTRAHRPEVCYPAQGFQIISQSRTHLQLAGGLLPVQRLVARQGSRNEPITYWVIVGEEIALSGTEQKLDQLSYSTRGLIPDGMLVRVSSIDGNVQKAYQLQASFVVGMTQAMDPTSRERVIGRASQTEASGASS
jgi:EpsI family protein